MLYQSRYFCCRKTFNHGTVLRSAALESLSQNSLPLRSSISNAVHLVIRPCKVHTKGIQSYKYGAMYITLCSTCNRSENKNSFNWDRPVDVDKQYSNSEYLERRVCYVFCNQLYNTKCLSFACNAPDSYAGGHIFKSLPQD
jgi:hypothetical protein